MKPPRQSDQPLYPEEELPYTSANCPVCGYKVLPDDAVHVAYTLDNGPDEDERPEDAAENYVRALHRAAEILRGEP